MKSLLTSPTRCLLVQPAFSPHSFWNYRETCRFVGARYPAPPLGLMTVAALLPQHWEFRLVDENVEVLADAHLEWADIVLVTGMLPQQPGILSTIRRAHAIGKPVAVGGPDATSQPEVYAQADYLVLGEGEVTIPPFLEDLGRSATAGRYDATAHADMDDAVVPRFDLIRFRDYLMVGVQFSRGCPHRCEFCDVIELFGRRPRAKTPDQVLRELQALYDLGHRGHVDLVDDNLIGNKRRLAEMLEALGDWSRHHRHPFYFSTEASIDLAREPELLDLMRENDFRYVFVGIETPDQDALAEAHKTQNARVDVADAVATLSAHGMIVNGGFILGFDRESPRVADDMVALIEGAGICLAMVGRLSALPNTRLERRLRREGRLFARSRPTQDALGVDQTTAGLEFATARPRTEILRDQARVLARIYSPGSYFSRVLRTVARLAPAHRHRPDLRAILRLASAFLRVSARMSCDGRTRAPYWRALAGALWRNPRAVDVVVNMAAMYAHLAAQSEFAVRGVAQELAGVEAVGEEGYNRMMLDGADPSRAPVAPVPTPVGR